MSGGSSPPSAPSYAGIGQSAQTFGTATANSQQATNAAQAYNQNANANLTSALGTANQNASTLSNSANQNLSQYASTFSPLQAQEAQAASQYGSNQNIQKLTGQAVANVNAGQQAAQQNNAAALAAEGVDPASIHGGAIQAAGNVQNAANAANAGTQAGIQAQQTAFGMQNQANQLGTQVGALGSQQAASGAQTALAGQSAANQTGATGVSNLANANSMLGQANQATQAGTQAQQAQFANQQTAYQDQQQQQAGVGQMVGNVAGMAAMAFMESGGPVMLDRGIPTYAAGGPVGVGSNYVPPMFPQRPQPSYVPRATQVLAGGKVTSQPMYNPAMMAMAGGGRVTDYAAGGQVMNRGALPTSPIPGSTDTKPALLTPGEFVIPRDVVQHLGNEHFHRLIDKEREKANSRRAIPIHHPPHQSAQ